MPEETPKDPSVVQILTQIHSGELNLEEHPLPKDIRLECVDHLWMHELQSIAWIANYLKVSEKTIRRDQDEINARNAQKLSTEDTVNLVGELVAKLSASHENLMRLARDKQGSVQERAQAGMYASKAIEGQIAILQKLGFAPSKPLQIEADVRHHQEEDVSVDQLKAELFELEKLADSKGQKDPEVIKMIEAAKQQIALAEAKNMVDDLRNNLNQRNGDGNSGQGQ